MENNCCYFSLSTDTSDIALVTINNGWLHYKLFKEMGAVSKQRDLMRWAVLALCDGFHCMVCDLCGSRINSLPISKGGWI